MQRAFRATFTIFFLIFPGAVHQNSLFLFFPFPEFHSPPLPSSFSRSCVVQLKNSYGCVTRIHSTFHNSVGKTIRYDTKFERKRIPRNSLRTNKIYIYEIYIFERGRKKRKRWKNPSSSFRTVIKTQMVT